jgi:hypothetical protein
MGTLAYAAIIFAAIAVTEVGSEVAAEIGSDFLFDLFNNYLWHPPQQAGMAPQPLDLLAELIIED